MKYYIKIVSLTLCLTMLTSCKRMSIPQYETITESTTEKTTERQTNLPETTVTPEPMAENVYSSKKIAHSYGVAKNGIANEISINAQKFFETNKFNIVNIIIGYKSCCILF